jgi:hypothetical protein
MPIVRNGVGEKEDSVLGHVAVTINKLSSSFTQIQPSYYNMLNTIAGQITKKSTAILR